MAELQVELPLTARNRHILLAMARLLGVPMAPVELTTTGPQTPKDLSLPSADFNEWSFAIESGFEKNARFVDIGCMTMNAMDHVQLDIKDGLGHATFWQLFFDARDDSLFDGKAVCPMSATDALGIAVGQGLVRFFGGTSITTALDGSTDYFEMNPHESIFPPRRLHLNEGEAPGADDRWYQFQNALRALQPLRAADLNLKHPLDESSAALMAYHEAKYLDIALPCENDEKRTRIRL